MPGSPSSRIPFGGFPPIERYMAGSFRYCKAQHGSMCAVAQLLWFLSYRYTMQGVCLTPDGSTRPVGCQAWAQKDTSGGLCPYLDHKFELPHCLITPCHVSKGDACAAIPAGLPLALRKLNGLGRIVRHLLPGPVQQSTILIRPDSHPACLGMGRSSKVAQRAAQRILHTGFRRCKSHIERQSGHAPSLSRRPEMGSEGRKRTDA